MSSTIIEQEKVTQSYKKKPSLSFSQRPISSHLLQLSVNINPQTIKAVYNQTINVFKNKKLDGFEKNETPDEYIQKHFKVEINKKIKNYLLKHHVISFLLDEIIKQKIYVSNYPRLTKIELSKNNELTFDFNASLADHIDLKEWQNFSFKPPKRKRYKDLDKQVSTFLDNEFSSSRNKKLNVVEDTDWICFEATMLDHKTNLFSPKLTSIFWMKIQNQEVVDDLKDLFLQHNLNDTFITNHLEQDGAIHNCEYGNYNFSVKILSIVKGSSTSLDNFKSNFKLKNKTEVHSKLIEIFSYRNDQSQRKAIVEELFHLLLTKHRFEVPKHLIIRRQEDILNSLKQQPDYQVYKSQDDFLENVELLAEKQLKEEIIIDQIAYKEGTKIDIKDVENYLYLFKHKRLKEFIYFNPLLEKIDQPNIAINSGAITHAVMREKTLNYIIHTLSI